MKTCTAVNCRCEASYAGVQSCEQTATHEFQLRPGLWLAVCADAARRLARAGKQLRELGTAQ
jgi:hypothetical protein